MSQGTTRWGSLWFCDIQRKAKSSNPQSGKTVILTSKVVKKKLDKLTLFCSTYGELLKYMFEQKLDRMCQHSWKYELSKYMGVSGNQDADLYDLKDQSTTEYLLSAGYLQNVSQGHATSPGSWFVCPFIYF